jgi:hypothetical protein
VIARPITSLARLCGAGALTVLGVTAVLQINAVVPVAAAGSSEGIFEVSIGQAAQLQPLPPGVTPVSVSAGISTLYAVGSDGNLYAWGDDIDGELGSGSQLPANNDSSVVVSLPAGVTPTAVAAGPFDAYAIGSDGNLYAWGFNEDGELGDGTTTGPDSCPINGPGQPGPTVPCSTTPVKVSLPSGVTPTAIAAGGANQEPATGYAIGSDGNLYAWGSNSSGQLGDGTTTNSAVPVKVSLPSGVTPAAIAGSSIDAYALDSAGDIYAWGADGLGNLGNGTNTALSAVPVAVTLPAGVTATAIAGSGDGGDGAAYFLGSDGHVYAWGSNEQGALGDGTTTGPETCSVPGPVPGSPPIQLPCSTKPAEVSLPSGTVSGLGGNDGGGYVTTSSHSIYLWGDDGCACGSATPEAVSLPTGSTPESLGQDVSGSDEAILNAPNVAPAITTQPTSQTVYSGTSASFTAAASGYPVPTVQWQISTDGGKTFAPVLGATTDTLAISGTTSAQNGDEYEAVFTNGSGTATTNPATLTVTPSVAPVVTTNPLSQSVSYGGTLTFSASASGTPTPTVHWQLSVDGGSSWIDLPQTTADPVTTGILTSFENGWETRAVFTNPAGTATTSPATITVTVPPPTTSVSLPSNGATVAGGVWLDASAQSVVGIKSVRYEVSGGAVLDMTVSSAVATDVGWLGAWDTTDVPNGTYTLQSVVTDNDGNSTTSAGITVTVDNMALQTKVLVPSSGATLSGSSTVLDASASGTADVTAVQFVVSGGSFSDHPVATAALTIYGWVAEWDTTSVPNGDYTLESVATETGGTTASSPPIEVSVAN